MFCLLHNITKIEVDFDGSGDSGSIDDVSVYQGTTIFPNETKLLSWEAGGRAYDSVKKEWVYDTPTFVEMELKELLEQIVYSSLEKSGVDWYNNDGGFGAWVWTPSDGLAFDVHVRFTESSCEYSENRNLGKAECES